MPCTLQVDVEGFEPYVFQSAENMLKSYKVENIVLEYNAGRWVGYAGRWWHGGQTLSLPGSITYPKTTSTVAIGGPVGERHPPKPSLERW